MQINRIQLINYRGFTNYEISCGSVTLLTGLNSAGKTSVLKAIQLLFDVFAFALGEYQRQDISSPIFTNIQWESNPQFGLNRLALSEHIEVFLNKSTAQPCEIIIDLSNGLTLHLRINNVASYTLDAFLNGDSLRTKIEDQSVKDLLIEAFNFRPAFVPPVSTIASSENFIPFNEMQSRINNGSLLEIWRSYLYWLCNDRSMQGFEFVAEQVKRFIPDANVLVPRLDHNSPPRVLVRFDQGDVELDISASGGGMRILIGISVILNFSPSECLLFDEPDTHLHPSLQRDIARLLIEQGTASGKQLFVTSHSPDFIGEFPTESILWVDRNETQARKCSILGEFLINLGSVSKADAIRVHGADKILFVEGNIDKKIIQFLFGRCGLSRNPTSDNQVIIAELPNGKGDITHIGGYRDFLRATFREDFKIACIVDNDYEQIQVEESVSSGIFRLSRKEIENYLIEPDVIFRALTAKGCVTDLATVSKKIEEICSEPKIADQVKYQIRPQLRKSLDNKLDASQKEKTADQEFERLWSDEKYRLENCPGKSVLAKIRAWAQEQHRITLTDKTLIDSLNNCPDDIADIARKISWLFYGND